MVSESNTHNNCSSCIGNVYQIGMISILCPTRGRRAGVIRLIESALKTAKYHNKIELLFYVDQDDDTLDEIDLSTYPCDIRIFKGPRVWISNAQNFLYFYARGEILMTAADDMEFLTDNWDEIIRNEFNRIPDKIALVFGNDLASHSGVIAVHGFFHQHWVHILGTWVQPGRGSLWDLWSTEIARKIDRLIYIENLHIQHIHYRQGEASAIFDKTYKHVYQSNSAFRPEISYKLQSRERRIDTILLAEATGNKITFEFNYFLGTLLSKHAQTHTDRRRLMSSTNVEIFCIIYRFLIKKIVYAKVNKK